MIEFDTAYRVATIRALEERAIAQHGADALMQRAAAEVAETCVYELKKRTGGVYGRTVLVAVGGGNNGGDALFAGARLARRGARVTAIRCLGTPHAAGLAALKAAGGRMIELSDLVWERWDGDPRHLPKDPPLITEAHLIIDGVFGIGGRPGLPEDVSNLASAALVADACVVAVDLPSGVDADTGSDAGQSCFEADVTVTFGALKHGHLVQPARARCGRVELVDIGLPEPDRATPALRKFTDLYIAWPYPDETSDKYSRGVVGIDTGSDRYPGAGLMSTCGAVYAGAGMVRYFGADKPAELIRSHLPNVVFGEGRVQAYLLGSGWGDRDDGDETIQKAIDSGLPGVVDADGLRYLPDRMPNSWLLTPHAGELAKLLEIERAEVTADPIKAVRAGADRTGATVLLKGASQLVARPNSAHVDVAVPGPAWTGQAGSGDVLGGVCAMVLASGFDAGQAGLFAASLQAQTARRNRGPLPPIELAQRFPGEIARMEKKWRRR